MSLNNFVSTAVLSSKDGIGFDTEQVKESEDVVKARVAAESQGRRPLFQQLADQRQAAQDERDAIYKSNGGPDKVLDEEDVAFFEEIEREKLEKRHREMKEEQEALEAFRAANVLADDSGPGSTTILGKKRTVALPTVNKVSYESTKKAMPLIVKRKKKARASDDQKETESVGTKVDQGGKAPKTAQKRKEEAVATTPAALSSLGEYGSDSD